MGIRFSRSIRLLPGIRINLGMKGSAVRFGQRGAWLAVGKYGRRGPLTMPGSGLGYSSWVSNAPAKAVRRQGVGFRGIVLAAAVGLLTYWLVRRLNG